MTGAGTGKGNLHSNSFDIVRLVAALAVVISHFYGMAFRVSPLNGVWGTDEDLAGFAVIVFFGLSGYLITESVLNGATLRFYITSRILRIYPALVTCLIVCVALGAFLTRLSPHQFFSAQTSQFFLGNVFPFFWQEQRILPGIFLPPFEAINAPLWTIKYELACYALTLIVFVLPPKWRRYGFVVLCLIAVASWLVPLHSWKIIPADTASNRVLRFEYFNMGFFRYYAAIFFLAAVARVLIENSPHRWIGLFVLLTFAVVLFYGTSIGLLAILCLVAFAGAALGCSSLLYFGGVFRQKIGDLSYSTYLYGWPISMLIGQLFYRKLGFWPTMAIAIATTLFVAWLSWRVIERPALRLKRLAAAQIPPAPAAAIMSR
jgi:peptidoglycan/LPS O-acetylase OafA/YrhL